MRYEIQDKHMGGTEHGTRIKSHMQSEVLITIEEKRLSGHRLYPFFLFDDLYSGFEDRQPLKRYDRTNGKSTQHSIGISVSFSSPCSIVIKTGKLAKVY